MQCHAHVVTQNTRNKQTIDQTVFAVQRICHDAKIRDVVLRIIIGRPIKKLSEVDAQLNIFCTILR